MKRTRDRRQTGNIFRSGPSWFVRFADNVLVDGVEQRKVLCKRLCAYDDEHRSIKSVRPFADDVLRPVNASRT